MSQITEKEILLFSKYIYSISGIQLGADKGYLLESRLMPLMKVLQLKTYAELYQRIQHDPGGELKKEIIDAITTNETFFFRDNTPFDLMKNKIIPDLIDRRRSEKRSGPIPIRIWSAACSTGQEVYSICMTLREMLPNIEGYDINILGTDISGNAVAQASYGKYNQFEIARGLPDRFLVKYFNKLKDGWRIIDPIRGMAKFSKIDLMQSFINLGQFDLIFCRNIAIYFSVEDRKKLFTRIASILSPGGALIVGGSETLSSTVTVFEAQQYLRGLFYIVKDSKKQPAKQISKEPQRSYRAPLVRKTPKRSVEKRLQQSTRRSVSKPVAREQDPVVPEKIIDNISKSVQVDAPTPPMPARSLLTRLQPGSTHRSNPSKAFPAQKGSLLSALENKSHQVSTKQKPVGKTGTVPRTSLLERIAKGDK